MPVCFLQMSLAFAPRVAAAQGGAALACHVFVLALLRVAVTAIHDVKSR